MRLFQNLSTTNSNNAWIFWKVYLWAGSLFIYQNGLGSGKAVDVTLENVLYFNFWVSGLYTFNSCAIIIEIGDDLDCNNIQKYGEQTVLQNYLHGEGKEVREETIFFNFRWNIVHTRQMKLW